MTNEELDEARGAEAYRVWGERPAEDSQTVAHVAARLAREGWTPPPPASDDLLAARAWLKDNTAHIGPYVDNGSADGVSQARAYLAGCTRGREGAKGLVEALEGYVETLAAPNTGWQRVVDTLALITAGRRPDHFVDADDMVGRPSGSNLQILQIAPDQPTPTEPSQIASRAGGGE